MPGRDLNPVIAVDDGRSSGKGVCRYRTQTLPELYKMGVDEPTRSGSLLSTTETGTAGGGVTFTSRVSTGSLWDALRCTSGGPPSPRSSRSQSAKTGS